MNSAGFVSECRRRGVRLAVSPLSGAGLAILYRFPRGVTVPPQFVPKLREHKAAIIGELLKKPAPEETPELLALGREAEEAVQERIAACPDAANQLARVMEAEGRAVGIYDTPSGVRLYEGTDGQWRHVPPGADPADFAHNVPPSYTLPRRCRQPATSAAPPGKCVR